MGEKGKTRFLVYPTADVPFGKLCMAYGLKPTRCVNMGQRRNALGMDKELLKVLPKLHVRQDGNYKCKCGKPNYDGHDCVIQGDEDGRE
jgi:hypothetical protein